MSAMIKLSIGLVVLCFLIQGVQTLRCYQCDKFHKNCDKRSMNSLSSYEYTCPSTLPYCRAREYSHDSCTHHGFERGCVAQCTVDDASNPKTGCCQTDLCNATQRPNPTPLSLILTGTSMAVIMKRFL